MVCTGTNGARAKCAIDLRAGGGARRRSKTCEETETGSEGAKEPGLCGWVGADKAELQGINLS